MNALLALVLSAPAFGLVVGHNGALGDGRADLRFADDDAARMYEVLRAGGVDATLLTTFDADSQQIFGPLVRQAVAPTPAAFTDAVKALRAKVDAARARGEQPEVFFFYSGHGNVEDGEGHLGLAGGQLSRTQLWGDLIEGVPATRMHVIVDACKSYFVVGGRGPGGRSEAYNEQFAGPKAPPGVGFILSTSSDAESHEWAAISGGVFSHEVRSALVGAADADGDGSVDYDELAAFVNLANAGIGVPRYRPRVFVRAPSAELRAPIFHPAKMTGISYLEVPAGPAGRLSITDERGLRYVDLTKAPTQPVHLALLAPRRYALRWQAQSFELQADGQPRRLADATPTPITVAARSEAHRAFEQLFTREFGPGVVDGYRLGLDSAAPPPLPVEPTDWLTPTLVGGGVVLLAGAGALGYVALDAQVEAGSAAQADRADLNDRTRAFGWSAAGVGAAGVGLLSAALYRYLTQP